RGHPPAALRSPRRRVVGVPDRLATGIVHNSDPDQGPGSGFGVIAPTNAGMAHEQLDGYLRALAQAGGSDLHVKVGSPPRLRVDGALRVVPGAPELRAEDTAAMADAVMRPDVR